MTFNPEKVAHCEECGVTKVRKNSWNGQRLLCPGGCDERRLAKLRSENTKRYWEGRKGNGNRGTPRE